MIVVLFTFQLYLPSTWCILRSVQYQEGGWEEAKEKGYKRRKKGPRYKTMMTDVGQLFVVDELRAWAGGFVPVKNPPVWLSEQILERGIQAKALAPAQTLDGVRSCIRRATKEQQEAAKAAKLQADTAATRYFRKFIDCVSATWQPDRSWASVGME